MEVIGQLKARVAAYQGNSPPSTLDRLLDGFEIRSAIEEGRNSLPLLKPDSSVGRLRSSRLQRGHDND